MGRVRGGRWRAGPQHGPFPWGLVGWRPQICAHVIGMRLECRWFLALRDCAVNCPQRWEGAAFDGSAASQARCARASTRALPSTQGVRSPPGPLEFSTEWGGCGPSPTRRNRICRRLVGPLACPPHPGYPSSQEPRWGQGSWGDGRGLSAGGGHLGNRRPSELDFCAKSGLLLCSACGSSSLASLGPPCSPWLEPSVHPRWRCQGHRLWVTSAFLGKPAPGKGGSSGLGLPQPPSPTQPHAAPWGAQLAVSPSPNLVPKGDSAASPSLLPAPHLLWLTGPSSRAPGVPLAWGSEGSEPNTTWMMG